MIAHTHTIAGPLRNTVADFWQMVMQQDTVAIVMLSTAASDSVKYWPDGGSERYGSITVSSQSEVVHPGFLVRYLVVSTESTSREVMHFQYLNWPDEHSGCVLRAQPCSVHLPVLVCTLFDVDNAVLTQTAGEIPGLAEACLCFLSRV